MKRATSCWGAAALALLVLGGCGGSGTTTSAPAPTPPSSAQVAAAIAAAAAVPGNDTSTNQTSAFTVLQTAGVPAATIGGNRLSVNFTVFSDGAVKTGLTLADMSFAVARVVPGAGVDPREWVSYISRKATATAGPGGAATPPATAQQGTTDPKVSDAQLVYNSAGYYTYTFTAEIVDAAWSATVGGVDYSIRGAFAPDATQRVAIQLGYTNAAGQVVRVNPYFDFTFAASGGGYASTPLTDPATQDLQVSTISSCNSCHEALSAHGGGMVATQYCVMCHNNATTDPDSGNVLAFDRMVHKIHAGRLLATVPGGEDYTIWGYRGTKYDYSDVGYPQDLRNCANCHSSSNPATPQGNLWQTVVTKETCLTCHANRSDSAWYASHLGFANVLVGPGADPNAMTNADCASCHVDVASLTAAVVHWPQEQVNQDLYKMVIDSVTFNNTADGKGRTVTVKYALVDPTQGNQPYRLVVNAVDCTAGSGGTLADCSNAMFGNLRAYLAYANIVGQPASPTEFSAYNNGGSVAYACLYEGPTTTACPTTAVNDGSNRYTATIPLPDDTPTQVASGTAMVATVGQIKELKLRVDWDGPIRPPVSPPVRINTAVQHSSAQLALTGNLQPVVQVVGDETCNVCHAVLGTASGSNTMPNAFHSGARNTWQSCLVCHDANRSSSTVMTNGLTLPGGAPFQEQFQFGYMIHGIHGNSKRVTPYTHGNLVFGKFDKDCRLVADPTVTCTPGTTNFAQTTLWPGPTVDGQKTLNCASCHVGSSYAQSTGTLGAVVSLRPTGSNPLDWNAITPKAASCVGCHNSDVAINHVSTAGSSRYGNATQAVSLQIAETCADCHAPTGFLSVAAAHKQK